MSADTITKLGTLSEIPLSSCSVIAGSSAAGIGKHLSGRLRHLFMISSLTEDYHNRFLLSTYVSDLYLGNAFSYAEMSVLTT